MSRSWGWPKEQGARTPADYEREAEVAARIAQEAGSAGLLGATDEPATVLEHRDAPLEKPKTVEREPIVTGFGQNHGDDYHSGATLDRVIDSGELNNN